MDVRGGFPASAPEPVCPQPVVRAVMTNRWRWLTIGTATICGGTTG